MQVVYHAATEECAAIGQGGLVYYYICAFGFYTFHYALNGGVAEIVAAGFHSEAVNAYGAALFVAGLKGSFAVIVVVTGHGQHAVGNEVFASGVAIYYGLYEVLRYILIIGKKLLGVLGKAIPAISE